MEQKFVGVPHFDVNTKANVCPCELSYDGFKADPDNVG